MQRSFKCEALHGDISQNQRERTLSGFRDGRFNILVATDVAARGLDVPNVDLVSLLFISFIAFPPLFYGYFITYANRQEAKYFVWN